MSETRPFTRLDFIMFLFEEDSKESFWLSLNTHILTHVKNLDQRQVLQAPQLTPSFRSTLIQAKF